MFSGMEALLNHGSEIYTTNKHKLDHVRNVMYGTFANANDRAIYKRQKEVETLLKDIVVHWSHGLKSIINELMADVDLVTIGYIYELFLIREYSMGRITCEMLTARILNPADARPINTDDENGLNELNFNSYLKVILFLINRDEIDLSDGIIRIPATEIRRLSKMFTKSQEVRDLEEASRDTKFGRGGIKSV